MSENENRDSTRRDLMRPIQLLSIAFISAVIAGMVAAISLGLFQSPSKPHNTAEQIQRLQQEVMSSAATGGLIVAGATFIGVLLVVSLLLLAVKPNDVTRTIETAVLLDTPEQVVDAEADDA